MKVLYLVNKGLMTSDLATSLILYGFDVVTLDDYECPYDIDSPNCKQIIDDFLTNNNIDFVISYNFIPSAAYVCEKHNIPYISWMYDAFFPILYRDALRLKCNRILVFDSREYSFLKNLDLCNVYYLPLCTNKNRILDLQITTDDFINYSNDISFVGKLYCSEGVNGYSQIKNYLPSEITTSVNSFIELVACKWNNNDDILSFFSQIDYSIFPKIMTNNEPKEKIFLPDNLYYFSICFSRLFAQVERTSLLNSLSEFFNTTLYTYEQPIGLSNNITIKPGVNYANTLPKIYNLSKINLNISLRNILSGLPLRVYDIMGAGGFLMTNPQDDFKNYFIDGVDYVSYENKEDLINKCSYYLNHENERIEIALHGYEKICKYHAYENRLDEIVKIIKTSS